MMPAPVEFQQTKARLFVPQSENIETPVPDASLVANKVGASGKLEFWFELSRPFRYHDVIEI